MGKNVFDSVGRFVDRNAPEILLGVGIAGMVTATVLSVKATPKAIKSIKKKKKELGKEKLTVGETISACWKNYILPAGIEIASIGVICFGGGTYRRRNAILATTAAMTESAFRHYTDKVVEVVGEKKAQQIQDKVAQERVAEHPVSASKVIMTGGDTLCFDSECNIYFKSDKNRIDKAINMINNQLNTSEDPEHFVPLNDFFYELDIPATKYGKMVGWRADRGMMRANYSSQLADDGTPVLVLSYNLTDRYGRKKSEYDFGK